MIGPFRPKTILITSGVISSLKVIATIYVLVISSIENTLQCVSLSEIWLSAMLFHDLLAIWVKILRVKHKIYENRALTHYQQRHRRNPNSVANQPGYQPTYEQAHYQAQANANVVPLRKSFTPIRSNTAARTRPSTLSYGDKSCRSLLYRLLVLNFLFVPALMLYTVIMSAWE